MLDEKDWNKINNILLELYSVRGAAALSGKILGGVGAVVPFSRGFFVIFDSDGKPCFDASSFLGFGKDSAEEILGCFNFSGFLAGKDSFDEAKSVFGEFQEFSGNLKNFRPPFFLDFMDSDSSCSFFPDSDSCVSLKTCPHGFCGLKPASGNFSVQEKIRGAVLSGKKSSSLSSADENNENDGKSGKTRFCAAVPVFAGENLAGFLFLCRAEDFQGFSEKEKYILDIFRKHISNMARNAIESTNPEFPASRCFENAVSDFSLSHREAEILRLIADGKSNAEICDGLCVSISTVKKHVYNIFNKAGVNSRTQLLNQIYRMRKGS